MLSYKATYRIEDGTYIGEVLDFPGTVAAGSTLDEARRNLAAALVDMAETNLLRGEPLPTPDPGCANPGAELEEPIHLILQAGHLLSVSVAAAP